MTDAPTDLNRRSLLWKGMGSVLIVLHLVAIVLAPASVPPASSSVQSAWTYFRPYLQAAYLNHGYHYFAPDPGPSSLLEYTVISSDGTRTWGRIPDRRKIWPRLRYHRHFMLTEFLGGLGEGEFRDALAQVYAEELLRQHDGQSVELSLVVHQLSSPEEVLAGSSLDEPHKYQITPIGTFTLADEIASPAAAEIESDVTSELEDSVSD